MDNRILVFLLLVIVIVGVCACALLCCGVLTLLPTQEPTPQPSRVIRPAPTSARPTPTKPVVRQYNAPPPMTIDPTKSYAAAVETNKGTFVIQLLPDAAPQTVNSFVFLARDGFYDGLTFHRVESWVVQGGDPEGTGMSGPGYTVPAEFESSVKYSQVRGIVGLARAQDPNSGGSQWYILKTDTPQLDGQYTTFGKVVEGMEVVDKLVIGDVMTSITIQEGE